MKFADFAHEVKEGLGISFQAIRANKMRSVLTTLGIVIGIVSVTLMGTAIEGMSRSFNDMVSKIGADVLFVQKFSWFSSQEDFEASRNRKNIDLRQFKTNVSHKCLDRDIILTDACRAWFGFFLIHQEWSMCFSMAFLACATC